MPMLFCAETPRFIEETGEYLFGINFSVLKGSNNLGKFKPNCAENSEALRKASGFFGYKQFRKFPKRLQ
jgi:hypothetical protein